MLKVTISVFLSLLIIPTAAWSQVPPGEHYPDGVLKIDWQPGEREGELVRREFYPDGTIKSEAAYLHENIDGIYKEYGPEGNLLVELGYVGGVEHGVFREFSANGSYLKEGYYENGMLSGPQKIYDEHGALYQVVGYRNGLKHGTAKVYAPDGTLKEESPYIDGELTGTVKFYNNDGSLRAESRYEGGRRQGAAAEYYPNGLLKAKMNFMNDEIEGEFIEYFEDQKIKKRILVVNGDIVERQVYDEQGNLNGDLSFPQAAPAAPVVNAPPVSVETRASQVSAGPGQSILRSQGWLVFAGIAYIAVLIIGVFIGKILRAGQLQEDVYQRQIRELAQSSDPRPENPPQDESQKICRGSLDAAQDGIFMANTNGRLFYVNETFAGIFGYGHKKDLAGASMNELFKDIVNQENQLLKLLGESEEIHDFRFRRRLPNDNVAVLSVYANRVFDDLGRPAGVQGIVSKITEIKQFEVSAALAGNAGADLKS